MAIDPSPCHFRINWHTFKMEFAGDYREIESLIPKMDTPDGLTKEEAEAERRRLRQAELDRMCPPEADLTCWQEEKEWRNPLAEKPKRK